MFVCFSLETPDYYKQNLVWIILESLPQHSYNSATDLLVEHFYSILALLTVRIKLFSIGLSLLRYKCLISVKNWKHSYLDNRNLNKT